MSERFPIERWRTVADLPPDGETVVIEASPAEREALAAVWGVPEVKRLVARLTVRSWRGRGAAVEGTVEGAVEQACVVTLEPVETAIDEPVSVRLLPGEAAGRDTPAEIDVDPLGEDPPETFERGRIDLGAIAAEHFALGIDPYPRGPGVAFDPAEHGVDPDPDGADEAEAPSPFAALAALRRDGRKD